MRGKRQSYYNESGYSMRMLGRNLNLVTTAAPAAGGTKKEVRICGPAEGTAEGDLHMQTRRGNCRRGPAYADLQRELQKGTCICGPAEGTAEGDLHMRTSSGNCRRGPAYADLQRELQKGTCICGPPAGTARGGPYMQTRRGNRPCGPAKAGRCITMDRLA